MKRPLFATCLVDERGGNNTVQALILVAILALGGVSAVRALSGTVNDKSACAGEAIAAMGPLGPCSESAAAGGAPGPAPDAPGEGPDVGPALNDAGELVALPFPGSVSVSCSATTGRQEQACGGPEGAGVTVDTTGSVSIERSETRLDITGGCPRQDLSVSTRLQVGLNAQAEGTTVGGALAIFTGTTSKFSVSVSPDAAEAIADGDRPPPNPVDPRTILPGESVELSEEFFAGHNLTATYRQLQLEMGFEEGRRLSSGVQRVDPSTVRIMVGDADFVRQALSLGVSLGDFGVAIGGSRELSEGTVRTVDIDISTAAGWAAYQEFLATGHLPAANAPGTRDPTTIDSLNVSGSTSAEVNAGPISIGGVLADSEGTITEVHHADGTVERVAGARFNNVGAMITDGTDGSTTFSLLIEGASRSNIENFEHLTGQQLSTFGGNNVRLDFTESDLRALRFQALDQLVQQARDNGEDLSRDEIERLLREDPRRLENAGLNDALDSSFEIAAAQSPEEILIALYYMGGFDGNGSAAIQALLDFTMATARARHGDRAFPSDHADSDLPGRSVVPDCD
jgi:hypothetical protein